MAYLDGVFSSRKISKLARENVVYMYLTGMETPDSGLYAISKLNAKL